LGNIGSSEEETAKSLQESLILADILTNKLQKPSQSCGKASTKKQKNPDHLSDFYNIFSRKLNKDHLLIFNPRDDLLDDRFSS